MPRKLPWGKGAPTPTRRPELPPATSNHTPKRQRLESIHPGSDTEDSLPPLENSQPTIQETRPPSTSPPPEAPVESFMIDGMEHDDKYRMVEDEFLLIAQHFTAHLHAAEYKRQEKLGEARNTQVITSISRPVVGKKPDHTSRKLASVSRSKTQRKLFESFESDDSNDDDSLPYVGTALHGLMDSPRKSASLLKIGSTAATTRAAAGFKKSSADLKLAEHATTTLPGGLSASSDSKVIESRRHTLTVSSDDDGDLNGPATASAPKSASSETNPTFRGRMVSNARSTGPLSNMTPSVKNEPTPEAVSIPQLGEARGSNATVSNNSDSRLSKPDRTRRQRVKQEIEQQKPRKLDEIPTFL